jgi:hypothetical protein
LKPLGQLPPQTCVELFPSLQTVSPAKWKPLSIE